MTIVTRFAPSPTGFLHIGGARTALYNYLLAKRHGGKFLLRVEDTDYDRNNAEAAKAILDGMAWLGMVPDEEPVFQSSRLEYHKKYVSDLLASGKAYYCTCSKEELDAKRAAAGEGWHYDRTCLDKSRSVGAVRLKVEDNRVVEWNDMVKGNISFNTREIDDFIIAREDGTPVYNLAVVCDDHDMGINTILRGDDHVSNTPKQILLYEALGWKVPAFGHVPMIYGSDKKKLSKRHGAMSVMDYKGLGYTPDAIINFLARLGWSRGNQEIFRRDELISVFSADNLSKSPAVFDFKKLDWVNKQHINSAPDPVAIITENIRPELRHRIPALSGVLLKRCSNFREMNEMLHTIENPVVELVTGVDLKSHSSYLIGHIDAGTLVIDNDAMKTASELKKISMASESFKASDVYCTVNMAIFGSRSAPDTAAICSALGAKEIRRRLKIMEECL